MTGGKITAMGASWQYLIITVLANFFSEQMMFGGMKQIWLKDKKIRGPVAIKGGIENTCEEPIEYKSPQNLQRFPPFKWWKNVLQILMKFPIGRVDRNLHFPQINFDKRQP